MFASSKNMSVAAGVGIGLAVGTAAAAVGSKMMTRGGRRAGRGNAAKCMRSVEGVLDNIASMTK